MSAEALGLLGLCLIEHNTSFIMPPKAPLTHFLCLPLVTSSSKTQLTSSLQQFAVDATDAEPGVAAEIPAKAIRPLGTLHLTLGVMSLVTQGRIDAASKFCQSLDIRKLLTACTGGSVSEDDVGAAGKRSLSSQTDTPSEATASEDLVPLSITLSGLHPMQTPSATSILYASPIDSTSRIHPFCLGLQQAFINAGFMALEDRPLRLHATIVNMIYAKEKKNCAKGRGHGNSGKGSRKLNAQYWIAKYQNFVWAKEIRIEKISICEMGARKTFENEELVNKEYLEVASIPLL